MDQASEIHAQGKADCGVKIIVKGDPVHGRVEVQDGSVELQSTMQHGASEVIGVIIPQGMEPGEELDQGCPDGSIDAEQDSVPIQITTSCLVPTDSVTSDTLFDVALSERFGYVYSLDRAEQVRRKYEVQTNTSYVAVSNIKFNFGQTEFSRHNHRIYWEEPQQETPSKSSSKIKFDGVPFILLSKRVLDCQHGRDWHKRNKEKEREKVERKRRKKPCNQETRKLGCLANITMREVICFPEFKIDDNSEYKRKMASKKLRTALKEGEVKGQKRIYIDLPEPSSHNHPNDQSAQITHQALDERVLKKLQELVGNGVLGVEEIRLHLQNFVKNEIFLGRPSVPLTNRRFFPSKFTIRAHIRRCVHQKQSEKQPEEVIVETSVLSP